MIALSIRRSVFAWILMSFLIVFGAIAAFRMGVSQLPDVDFPIVNVSISYEGASPEVVEADLIDPLEQRLLSVEGIKEMRSTARLGTGNIQVEFDIDRDVDVALQEVQTAISQYRLPPGVDPAVVRKQNPEESPIMFLAVWGDKPLREMILWTDGFLLDQLRFIPGIGEVSIGGFSQRNMRIWPDPVKLKAADLTVLDLVDAIGDQHLETAAGQLVTGSREMRVRWLGEAVTAEDFEKISILRRGGGVIQDSRYTIGSVAKVEDGLSDIRRMARVDGKEAVSISVRKQRGVNEVELAKAVYKKLDELKAEAPKELNFRVNVDFTAPTEAVVHTTMQKLWIASLVTILVCFCFLGSLQSALNILFSIPTSIVGTFIVLYFAGFTLNLFTLLALTLAVSIVVDDAIMLLENIVRHYRMGKSPAKAAYDGAVEILPAATAATLAVIAVFLPVVFMDGITGKFFFQFGVTISAAVLLSLVEAVTITPMRAAAFLSAQPKISKLELWLDRRFESVAESYRIRLEKVTRFPKTVVLSSTVLFLGSLFLIQGVKTEFVPSQDQNIIFVQGQTPLGSSLDFTYRKALEVEKVLQDHPDIAGFFLSIGAGGPSSDVNSFSAPSYLRPREERSKTHAQIMDELREKTKELKDVRLSFRDVSARGLTSGRQFPLSFNLSGPDLNVLSEKSAEIMKKLTEEGLARDLDTDFKTGLPELRMTPDRKAMAARGVSIQNVSRTLGVAVAGVRQTRYTADGRRYDIRVKLADDRIHSLNAIKDITVRNIYSYRVPLSGLVTAEEQPSLQSIVRINRARSVGVFGSPGVGLAQGQALQKAEEVSRSILPEGYTFHLEGASAGLAESFKSLTLALVLGIVVAYMILAVQYNSFIHPFTVLMALPFSVTGALLALWITGVSLNLFSFIGLIVLMGIAKKNSILLVEFANQVRERREGEANWKDPRHVRDCLLEAAPVRLRPILMTSIATVFAALPLVIGNSIGQETRTPMGLTIIGGSILSTLLTLFVIPCLYLVLSRLERMDPARKKRIERDLSGAG